MAWFECTGGSGGGGGGELVYKTYAKFNGNGIVLPWTQNSDYTIECVFHEVTYTHNTCITGNSGGYTAGQYIAAYQNRFDVGTGGSYSNLGSWSAGEHTYVNNDANNQSTLDGTATANYTPTTNSYYYTIGCREGGTMGYYGYIKSFKIYSKTSGTLLHDLRPCSIKNLAAFHDVISDDLYTCANLTAVDEIPS